MLYRKSSIQGHHTTVMSGSCQNEDVGIAAETTQSLLSFLPDDLTDKTETTLKTAKIAPVRMKLLSLLNLVFISHESLRVTFDLFFCYRDCNVVSSTDMKRVFLNHRQAGVIEAVKRFSIFVAVVIISLTASYENVFGAQLDRSCSVQTV